MAKNINHHLYPDKDSGVWYFQKKVRGREKPYKLSLETRSKLEARRKRDEYLKQIDQQGFITTIDAIEAPETMVFGEVAVKWSEIVKTQIAETTFQNYQKVMNAHVLPAFGNHQIDAITSLDIEVFISKFTCGSKTKQNILTPFRLVMKFAKKHKIIQSNPFVDVDPIKKTKSAQKRPLSMEEINRFIHSVDEFWKQLFIVLFFSGIRIAEASALKWKHIDLANSVVKIRRNLVRLKGGAIVYKKPKTDSSIRDVKVPGFVVEALREQRKRTWEGNGDDFVFLNKKDRPIHRHTINRLVIKPTLESLGISTAISIKDTRASFITNALDQNERMSYVQKQVGHTTTRMIVDHYYRYVPAPDDGAKLENAWKSTSILPE
ncbi:MAG: site-specific integrase [Desulfosarcina sp.]|nr:site-specific integrase [Desulfosarcina sp.]